MLFMDSPPPFTFLMVHPRHPANYSVSLLQSVGMTLHRVGVITQLAQGVGLFKGHTILSIAVIKNETIHTF